MYAGPGIEDADRHRRRLDRLRPGWTTLRGRRLRIGYREVRAGGRRLGWSPPTFTPHLGLAALRSGRGLLLDVAMVRAGARCGGAAAVAAAAGSPRAAAGMALAWDGYGRGGVVVIGGAPTALLAALDLAAVAGAPACVIATCPGFTLAGEAKAALNALLRLAGVP